MEAHLKNAFISPGAPASLGGKTSSSQHTHCGTHQNPNNVTHQNPNNVAPQDMTVKKSAHPYAHGSSKQVSQIFDNNFHQIEPMKLTVERKPPSLDLPAKEQLLTREFIHTKDASSHISNRPTDEKRTKKPFKCKECSSEFRSNSHLVLHVRTHTGERPYICCICKASFSQSSHLKVHMRTHSEDRPHVCDVCGKAYKSMHSLKVHQVGHSKDHTYLPCSQCDKKFPDKHQLKSHLKVHSEEKPYSCDVCQKKFRDLSYVNKHKLLFCSNKTPRKRSRKKKRKLVARPVTSFYKANVSEANSSSTSDKTIGLENGDQAQRRVGSRGRPKGSLNKKTLRNKFKLSKQLKINSKKAQVLENKMRSAEISEDSFNIDGASLVGDSSKTVPIHDDCKDTMQKLALQTDSKAPKLQETKKESTESNLNLSQFSYLPNVPSETDTQLQQFNNINDSIVYNIPSCASSMSNYSSVNTQPLSLHVDSNPEQYQLDLSFQNSKVQNSVDHTKCIQNSSYRHEYVSGNQGYFSQSNWSASRVENENTYTLSNTMLPVMQDLIAKVSSTSQISDVVTSSLQHPRNQNSQTLQLQEPIFDPNHVSQNIASNIFGHISESTLSGIGYNYTENMKEIYNLQNLMGVADGVQNLSMTQNLNLQGGLDSTPQNLANLPPNLSNMHTNNISTNLNQNPGIHHNLNSDYMNVPQNLSCIAENLSSEVFESNRENGNFSNYNDNLGQTFSKLHNANSGPSTFTQFSNLNNEMLSSVSQNIHLHDLSSMPQNLSVPDNSMSLDLSSMSTATMPQNLSLQALSTMESNQKDLVSYPLGQYVSHQMSTMPQNVSTSSALHEMSQLAGKLIQPQNLSIDNLVQPENLTVPQNLTLDTQRRNVCVDSSRQSNIEHALPQNLSCQNLAINSYGMSSNNYSNVVSGHKSIGDPLLYGSAMQDLSTLIETEHSNLQAIQDLSCNHKISQNPQEILPQNLSLNTTLEPQNLTVSLRPENLSYNKAPSFNSNGMNSSFIMPRPQNLSQSHSWL